MPGQAIMLWLLPALVVCISACSQQSTSTSDHIKISFTATPAPQSVAEFAGTYTRTHLIIQHENGSQQQYPLQYKELFSVQDRPTGSDYAAGQLFSIDGSPLQDPFNKPLVSESPDGNSLLDIDGKLYLVTHYESDWLLSNGEEAKDYRKEHGDWPKRFLMSMTLTTLNQDNSGNLQIQSQHPIDLSAIKGIYIPCFASQTPWHTHLGSEENYDIDARKVAAGKTRILDSLSRSYFQSTEIASPYHYGHIPEITVSPQGETTAVKHYAMGRATWEMGKVMADQRTVYLGSDGKYQPLLMFVADKPADLSVGTLYAAKWQQLSAENGGSASLAWIKLGHADDAGIQQLADRLVFNDIFTASPYTQKDFVTIRANKHKNEFLKLESGMATAAAFLETSRYAAYRGATTEFNKMEGVSVNERDKKVYIAITAIAKGMQQDRSAPVDDIRLPVTHAGAVYELDLAADQKDMDGHPIASDYVATNMRALLVGTDSDPDKFGNTAAIDSIANPDNIFYSEQMRTLFIGEDSSMHVANFLWAYQPDTKQLTRILSAVAGAELSGLQNVDDLNGHTYIMINTQHPGDLPANMPHMLKKQLHEKIDRFNATVGYLFGPPGLSAHNDQAAD